MDDQHTGRPRPDRENAQEAGVDRAVVAARLAGSVGRISRRARSGTASLSVGFLSALVSIDRLGPIRPSELARHEVITKPTMTRVLGELERRGFIERADDPSDRRAFVVSATPAGVQAVRDATTTRNGIVTDLLAGLSDDDLSAISAALDALDRVANAAPGPS